MPATFTWIGTNPIAFHDSASWVSSDPMQLTPLAGDDLIFQAPTDPNPGSPPPSPPPSGGEPGPTNTSVPPIGGDPGGGTGGGGTTTPNGSITDCVIPTAIYFNSIQLISGYTGTVTVQDEQTVNTLVIEVGAIAQAGSSYDGYDLYVTGTLLFTGGTLNSSADLGIVHLQGATGTIDPAGGELELGSTLSLVSRSGVGTTLSQFAGTMRTTNGAGMDVYANCNYELPEQPGAGPVKVLKKQGRVEKDGVINLYENGTENINQAYETDAGINVQGGKLVVNNDASVTGKLGPASTISIELVTGSIYLKNGVTLTTPKVSLFGGNFFTTPAANGTPQVATIDGIVNAGGSSIQLGFNAGQQHVWSELSVKQDFFMSGGTFKVTVDGTTGSTNCDKITALKTMRCTGEVTVSVLNPPQGGVASRSWLVFQAIGGITQVGPSVENGWSALCNDNPVTKIYIRKD